MKSSIKLVPLIFLTISSMAFTSQQQKPEDRQFEREQESKNRSALANATAADQASANTLQQQTAMSQAKLDALQFAKEQETKKIHEKSNAVKTQGQNQKIRDGLKELLDGTKIKDKDFDVDLVDRLPSDVQRNIATMAYSRGFNNGYKLLPALIPRCDFHQRPSLENVRIRGLLHYKRSFDVQGIQSGPFYELTHVVKESQKKGKNLMLDLEPQTSVLRFRTQKPISNYNLSGILVNDTLFLKKGPEREFLENCTLEQIALLKGLWEKNNSSKKHQFILDERESRIYYSLPQAIQNCLKTNYRILSADEIRQKRCCTRIALATLTSAAAAVTAWFMNQ